MDQNFQSPVPWDTSKEVSEEVENNSQENQGSGPACYFALSMQVPEFQYLMTTTWHGLMYSNLSLSFLGLQNFFHRHLAQL